MKYAKQGNHDENLRCLRYQHPGVWPFEKDGLQADRVHTDEVFTDPDDVVLYEVALSKEDAFLVTGNTKHFPAQMTPARSVKMIFNSLSHQFCKRSRNSPNGAPGQRLWNKV